ncbi:MAG TPA: HEPN domain-containing protein [Candidatus Nanoarchaeia archaeon]|nr:HEPN domain-containing protein [Candidatus Nanoarchaeia archaeon]
MNRIDLKKTEEIDNKVNSLCDSGAIKTSHKRVPALIGLMAKKANNNLKFARASLKISDDKDAKEMLGLDEGDSFYDWVIITAYYSMFHMAHALLATKEIKIGKIRAHEATLYAMAKYFILNGELADELFVIYEDAEAKAEELFNSLSDERNKRGEFTYERLPKTNRLPAVESIKNASQFVRDIGTILKKRRYL